MWTAIRDAVDQRLSAHRFAAGAAAWAAQQQTGAPPAAAPGAPAPRPVYRQPSLLDLLTPPAAEPVRAATAAGR